MVRKTLTVTVVVFGLYYLVTAPESAAAAVRALGEALAGAGLAFKRFFDALISGGG